MSKGNGRCVWIFPDGDLPPAGEPGLPLEGHESLVVVNTGDEEAAISIDVYFTDQEPEAGLQVTVGARRVRCFRIDQPLGDRGYRIPFGQYALRLTSTVPVVAQLGRADVRQEKLSYYTTMGYGCE